MTDTTIIVKDIKRIDMLEMEGHDGIEFEKVAVPDGAHGELTLYTAVIATTAIVALAAYLLRKHNNEEFEETVEIMRADGTRESRTIKWKSSSSEPPSESVIKEIRGSLL